MTVSGTSRRPWAGKQIKAYGGWTLTLTYGADAHICPCHSTVSPYKDSGRYRVLNRCRDGGVSHCSGRTANPCSPLGNQAGRLTVHCGVLYTSSACENRCRPDWAHAARENSHTLMEKNQHLLHINTRHGFSSLMSQCAPSHRMSSRRHTPCSI